MNNNQRGGIGFVGMLQIVFIVLKIIDAINWSWWWVLSPIIACVALCVIGVILIVIVEGRK